MQAHDSGPRWCATPFLCGSLIRYSLPVYPGAFLDHPICPVKHRLRNRNADLFRSSEIDHQFKFRRLLHGKITRLSAFQNLVNEVGSAPERIRLAHPVGHETKLKEKCDYGRKATEFRRVGRPDLV